MSWCRKMLWFLFFFCSWHLRRFFKMLARALAWLVFYTSINWKFADWKWFLNYFLSCVVILLYVFGCLKCRSVSIHIAVTNATLIKNFWIFSAHLGNCLGIFFVASCALLFAWRVGTAIKCWIYVLAILRIRLIFRNVVGYWLSWNQCKKVLYFFS
jgi:hypothetical protein